MTAPIVYRVTFHEWQKFQILLPASNAQDAIRIAECIRHEIGAVCPIEEIAGGTEDFEACEHHGEKLAEEDVARFEKLLPGLQEEAHFQASFYGDEEELAVVERFRALLSKLKRGVP
jgi:hypothetical protein